jgi:hypothetical protein
LNQSSANLRGVLESLHDGDSEGTGTTFSSSALQTYPKGEDLDG